MSVITILILLAQNFGLGRVYPWNLIPFDGGRWLWILAALGLLVLLAEQAGFVTLGLRWHRVAAAIERGMGHRAALIVLLAGNALFAAVSYNHFGALGYKFPWVHFVILGVAVPFVRKDRYWLSCVVGLALLVASIIHFPLVAGRSDFLLAIQRSLNSMALEGKTYAPGFAPAGVSFGATTYLPGVLLAHLPAWVLGLDLRWGQVIWRAGWMIGIGLALTRHPVESPWRTVAHVFILNPYFNFRHELHYEAFFAWLVAYQAWPRWRWVFFPLLIWTRQWVWVVAPFVLLDWLADQSAPLEWQEHERLTWAAVGRQAAWLAAGSVLVSFVFVVVLWPTTQWSGFVSRAVGLAVPRNQFEYGLTLGPLAGLVGFDTWVRPIQAVLAAALGVWTAWRWWQVQELAAEQRTALLENMGLVALCAFVLLNPFFEIYYWFDATFWILAAYVFRPQPRRGIVRGIQPRPAAPR